MSTQFNEDKFDRCEWDPDVEETRAEFVRRKMKNLSRCNFPKRYQVGDCDLLYQTPMEQNGLEVPHSERVKTCIESDDDKVTRMVKFLINNFDEDWKSGRKNSNGPRIRHAWSTGS